jgi:hypothetical protein
MNRREQARSEPAKGHSFLREFMILLPLDILFSIAHWLGYVACFLVSLYIANIVLTVIVCRRLKLQRITPAPKLIPSMRFKAQL